MRSLNALSNLLGDKPYLMGDEPTSVDAISFAMLAGLLTPFFNSDLRRRALQIENLCDYVGRMMAEFYPEFVWAEAA